MVGVKNGYSLFAMVAAGVLAGNFEKFFSHAATKSLCPTPPAAAMKTFGPT